MAEKHNAREKGYEDYHLNIGPVLAATAGIIFIAILSFIAMWAMFLGLEQAVIYMTDDPPPMAAHQKPYEGPLIQTVPSEELTQVRAETNRTLTEYGWVDRDAGVVHLPIERAIDLVLERGFPVRE